MKNHPEPIFIFGRPLNKLAGNLRAVFTTILTLFLGSFPSHASFAVGQKSTGLGLDFWIELPSTTIVSGDSIPVIMAVSNTLSVSRPFFQRKGAFFDTSIGDFYVVDATTGQPVESPVNLGDRRSYTGTKGTGMRPHETIRAEGYLDRTFPLTNAGNYLIFAKAQFRSTNWDMVPPDGWIILETPPIQIEILPPTNVIHIKETIDPQIIPPSAPTVPSGRSFPPVTKGPHGSNNPPSTSNSVTVPSESRPRRDALFGALTLLPIVALVAWILWRRIRKGGLG